GPVNKPAGDLSAICLDKHMRITVVQHDITFTFQCRMDEGQRLFGDDHMPSYITLNFQKSELDEFVSICGYESHPVFVKPDINSHHGLAHFIRAGGKNRIFDTRFQDVDRDGYRLGSPGIRYFGKLFEVITGQFVLSVAGQYIE